MPASHLSCAYFLLTLEVGLLPVNENLTKSSLYGNKFCTHIALRMFLACHDVLGFLKKVNLVVY